jgi:hypothetical protein
MSIPAVSPATVPGDRAVKERRASVRHLVQRDSFCQPGTGRSDQFWRFAKILDLSDTGVRLQMKRGFPVGAILAVELSSSDGNFARTVEAQVVRSTEESGGWHLGCTFVDRLSAEDLAALL